MANLSTQGDIETYLQQIISDDTIGTTFQDDLIDQAHEFIGYSFTWPFMRKLFAKNVLAYESAYDLPSDWREFDALFVGSAEYKEVDREQLRSNNNSFAIDRDANQILLNPIPTTSQSATTVTNLESAASDVVIEVADASIFSVGIEVFIENGTNPQTTIVSALDTDANTITATLKYDTATSDPIWILGEGIHVNYLKTSTKMGTDTAATTDLPVWLRPRIAEYAAYLYYLSIEEPAKAGNWLATFNSRIREHRLNLAFQSTMGGVQFSIDS